MKIRRTFFSLIKSDKKGQRALSLTIMLKNRLTNSRLEKYSVNKLVGILGVSYKTINKYLPIMLDFDFIHFEGTVGNKVLVVNKLASKHTGRNVDISAFNSDSFNNTCRSLQSFIMMKIQAGKDYVKQLLQIYQNPPKGCDYKALKRKVRKLVMNGVLNSLHQEYKEYGLSFGKIAREVGCCVRTAQRIVGYAMGKGWVTKQHNYEWFYSKDVDYRYVEGYTFTTKDYLYVIHANIYTLSPSISIAFGLPSSSQSPDAVGW